MKKSEFLTNCPGKLVPLEFTEYPDGALGKPTKTLTSAFAPDPLPPNIDWKLLKIEHFDSYSSTIAELGRLNGLHRRVGNAASLLRTLWMREAKLSSEIEDIDTTAEELVLAGAGRTLGVRESGKESWNYVKALEHGVGSTLPFSSRVIKDMHRHLLTGVRGEENRPGEFRNCNVYLGDRTLGVKKARFVPPPHGETVIDAISDLEKFVNEEHQEIPPLFVIALTHYQFETIHPFRDGNGRIGRVLISRSLVKEGLLDHPVVYMSAYINEHRREYVDLLLRISQEGGDAWSDWIGFILEAIRTQALDTIWRSEELITLKSRFHDLLKKDDAPTRLFPVVDDLFSTPALNVADLVGKSDTSKTTAGKDVARLERLGILREYTGRERERDWLAQEIVDIISKESD